MAQYKIIKLVDFGPWTIGDKNYGPLCPSCMVPINNYAPKIGDVIEGIIETQNYYVIENNKKVLKTGKGLVWPIATNGNASTQAQRSDQFIIEDLLEAYEPVVENPDPNISIPGPENPSNPIGTKEESFWSKYKLLILVVLLFLIIVALND